MTRHWRLAAGGTTTTLVLAVPAAMAIAYYASKVDAFSFAYGVVVGLFAFLSIALVVALMANGNASEKKLALGFGVYLARLMFAGLALLIPIFAGSWPVAPMVGGFVGVYVVENVALLVGASKRPEAMSVRRVREVEASGTER